MEAARCGLSGIALCQLRARKHEQKGDDENMTKSPRQHIVGVVALIFQPLGRSTGKGKVSAYFPLPS